MLSIVLCDKQSNDAPLGFNGFKSSFKKVRRLSIPFNLSAQNVKPNLSARFKFAVFGQKSTCTLLASSLDPEGKGLEGKVQNSSF
jgi:hypothetical protein